MNSLNVLGSYNFKVFVRSIIPSTLLPLRFVNFKLLYLFVNFFDSILCAASQHKHEGASQNSGK